MVLRSQVRAHRSRQGLSQAALARAAGLSRQSLHAIESGRSVPAVDVALRLAERLRCPVEQLFALGYAQASTRVEVASPACPGARVVLSSARGRWVAHPLPPERYPDRAADGVLLAGPGPARAAWLGPAEHPQGTVVLMGCAPALGVLAERLSAQGAGRFVWLSCSSRASLRALASGHASLAGVHGSAGPGPAAESASVRRVLKTVPHAVFHLARWEEGLVVARGNPKGIRQADDLGRRHVRLVTREDGAVARQLLEELLARAGVPHAATLARARVARSHFEVAAAVSLGLADVGVAMRGAALAHGLDFVPVREESLEVVVPLESLEDERMARLLDVLRSASFQSEVDSLGGYDARDCGARVGGAAP